MFFGNIYRLHMKNLIWMLFDAVELIFQTIAEKR